MSHTNRLTEEREANPLDTSGLTEYLYGGKEAYQLHKEALEYLLTDTDFLNEDYSGYDLARAEIREVSFRNMKRIREMGEDIGDDRLFAAVFELLGSSGLSAMRLGLSWGFFGNAVKGQGTQEQVEKYMPRLERLEITGCWCITELATGSYVKAFQTTATFIDKTDEFEINTPTLTASKWWVGNSAQTATHGVVMARLIVNGEDHGPHNFVVRLRDENFQLTEGVAIGDLGPKRGSNGVDNGWLQFDHVRIPREQMLMKWSQVDRDGTFNRLAIPQISYFGLMGPRVMAGRQALEAAERAVTIASRYCIVRDQYSMEGKCLLDYTTQQERLIGALSSVYAYKFATSNLYAQLEEVTGELSNNDTSHLKELHNNVAAYKGFVTLWGSRAINDCILALGGHSYSQLSGLPWLLADSAQTIPYDGDAIVLAQQTASYLVKTALAAHSAAGGNGAPSTYISAITAVDEMKSSAEADEPLSLADMEEAAKWLSLRLVKRATTALGQARSELPSDEEAWNACQLQLVRAARAHFMYTVIESFQDTLRNRLPDALGQDSEVVLLRLTELAQLFAAKHLQDSLSVFYEEDYFPTSRGTMLEEQIADLYRSIRPYVCRLVDAFDLHDRVLATPLGRFDGDVYEHYFKAVNSLPQDVSPSYWDEIIASPTHH